MTASEINISLEKIGIFGETRDLYWKIKNLLEKNNFIIHKEYIRTLCPGRGNGNIVGKKKFEKMWNTLKQAGLLKVFQVKENNRYTYQYMLLDTPDFTMPPYQILPLKEYQEIVKLAEKNNVTIKEAFNGKLEECTNLLKNRVAMYSNTYKEKLLNFYKEFKGVLGTVKAWASYGLKTNGKISNTLTTSQQVALSMQKNTMKQEVAIPTFKDTFLIELEQKVILEEVRTKIGSLVEIEEVEDAYKMLVKLAQQENIIVEHKNVTKDEIQKALKYLDTPYFINLLEDFYSQNLEKVKNKEGYFWSYLYKRLKKGKHKKQSNNSKSTKQNKPNKFHNFEQRKTDYNKLIANYYGFSLE